MKREEVCLEPKYMNDLLGDTVVYELKVENFENVEKGQLLAYAIVTERSEYPEPIPIYSKSQGCFKRTYYDNGGWHNGLETLGYIYPNCEEYFSNVPVESIDEITQKRQVKWERVGGYRSVGIPFTYYHDDKLYISCVYEEGKVLMELYTIDYFDLNPGDAIFFKFQNGKVLDFTIDTNPSRVIFNCFLPENEFSDYHEERGNEILQILGAYKKDAQRKETLKRISFLLSTTELYTFINEKLEAYEIVYASDGKSSGDQKPYNFMMSPKVCPNVIKDMFRVMIEQTGKFDAFYTLANINKRHEDNSVYDYFYVYLVSNKGLDNYEIDLSLNVENMINNGKTSVELLACHKYPSREVATATLSAIHEAVNDSFVRGNCYKLSEKQVSLIKEALGVS